MSAWRRSSHWLDADAPFSDNDCCGKKWWMERLSMRYAQNQDESHLFVNMKTVLPGFARVGDLTEAPLW